MHWIRYLLLLSFEYIINNDHFEFSVWYIHIHTICIDCFFLSFFFFLTCDHFPSPTMLFSITRHLPHTLTHSHTHNSSATKTYHRQQLHHSFIHCSLSHSLFLFSSIWFAFLSFGSFFLSHHNDSYHIEMN